MQSILDGCPSACDINLTFEALAMFSEELKLRTPLDNELIEQLLLNYLKLPSRANDVAILIDDLSDNVATAYITKLNPQTIQALYHRFYQLKPSSEEITMVEEAMTILRQAVFNPSPVMRPIGLGNGEPLYFAPRPPIPPRPMMYYPAPMAAYNPYAFYQPYYQPAPEYAAQQRPDYDDMGFRSSEKK